MRTITLSDVDVQIIVDALRFKHALLLNELLRLPEEPAKEPAIKPVVEPPIQTAKYGLKKDGTPRRAPGRPRKKK